jgi:hypothetical protein
MATELLVGFNEITSVVARTIDATALQIRFLDHHLQG